MPGPWEKYQAPQQSEGPWQKYQPDSVPESDLSHEPILNQIGKGLLSGAQKVGSAIDSYGGAPTRSALGALQEGKGIGAAAQAFGHQFGGNPEEAPTGKDLAARQGLSTDESINTHLPYIGTVSPAGIAGTAVDVLADPINILPVGKILKGGAGLLARGAEKAVAPIAKAASEISQVGKQIGTKALSKAGSALTGIPENEIKTYVKNIDEVNALGKKYHGDMATAADDVREGFARDIRGKRQELNGQISTTLKAASPKRNLVIKDVIDTLESEKTKLNPKFKAEEIAAIDDMIAKTKEVMPTGKSSLGDLFDLKEHLQERASGSYQKAGQIFIPGKDSQRAAKVAAAEARKILNKAAPEIAEANNKLALMHRIEGDLNKNVIAAGKPEGALLGAGSAPGSRQAKNLQRLDKIVGKDFQGQAEKLSSARRFSDASLLPVDTTGKTFTRLAAGAALGALTGPGAWIGAAFTSPLALKAAINAGKISTDVIGHIVGHTVGTGTKLSDAVLKKAVQIATGPNGDKVLRAAFTANMAASRNANNQKKGLMK